MIAKYPHSHMNRRLRSESLWRGLAMAIVEDGDVDYAKIEAAFRSSPR